MENKKKKKSRYVKQVLSERTCEYSACGVTFQPKRKWQKCCCSLHRMAAWKEKKTGIPG